MANKTYAYWWLILPAIAWFLWGFWAGMVSLAITLVLKQQLASGRLNQEQLSRSVTEAMRQVDASRVSHAAPGPTSRKAAHHGHVAPAEALPSRPEPAREERPAAPARPPGSASPGASFLAPSTPLEQTSKLEMPSESGPFRFEPTRIQLSQTVVATSLAAEPADGRDEFERVLASLQSR